MAESGIMESFRVLIYVMLFYSVSITLLAYALPAGALNFVTVFSEGTQDTSSLDNLNAEVQDSLTRQTNIPVIELGALVFYSGNILVDLLVNFVYALPQMFGLLIHGITSLFNLDAYIFQTIQAFATILMTVMYILGIIQLITGLRSGTNIV